MASSSVQDIITRAQFTVLSQTTGKQSIIYETMAFKALDIRQWRFIEKWGTNYIKPIISPVYGWKALLGRGSRIWRQKPKQSRKVSLMWGDWDRSPGGLWWPDRIQTGVCCTESPQTTSGSPFKSSVMSGSTDAWEEATQVWWAEGCWERCRKTTSGAHKVPGALPAVASHVGQPRNSGGVGGLFRRSRFSSGNRLTLS